MPKFFFSFLVPFDFHGLVKNYLSHSHGEMLLFQICQHPKLHTDHEQNRLPWATDGCQENWQPQSPSPYPFSNDFLHPAASPSPFFCAAVLQTRDLGVDLFLGLSNPTASFYRNQSSKRTVDISGSPPILFL